ncbi:MAG: hypothetical protein FRX49_07640 [Trebouxia sp. A1-2]|nr:MAG: hypothetical protein FRX49_07640 [Trebouxia sp. A1-2]
MSHIWTQTKTTQLGLAPGLAEGVAMLQALLLHMLPFSVAGQDLTVYHRTVQISETQLHLRRNKKQKGAHPSPQETFWLWNDKWVHQLNISKQGESKQRQAKQLKQNRRKGLLDLQDACILTPFSKMMAVLQRYSLGLRVQHLVRHA